MRKISLRRSKRNRRSQRRKPINVLASTLTTAGLACGMASVFAAIDGDFAKAAYLIFGAIFFDTLDGTVAKLTHTTSEFGKQLDSLADLASFGAAPAVLIYTAFLHEARGSGQPGGTTGSLMAIIFVICGALRLARYNVYQSEMRDFFVGLPIPAAAGTVASFVLFIHHFQWKVATWILSPMTLGLAYLMVSTLRYPKDRMKAVVIAPRNAFRLLVFCGLAIALILKASEHSPAIALFPLAAVYVMFGVVDAIYLRLLRRPRVSAEAEPTGEPSKPPQNEVRPGTQTSMLEPNDPDQRPYSQPPSNTGDFL